MQEMPPEEEWIRDAGTRTNEQHGQGRELPRPIQFLIGIIIGLIPVLMVFISLHPALFGFTIPSVPYGSLNLTLSILFSALVAYMIEIVVMAGLLSIKRVRFIGYGLLAMVLIAPVVSYIACMVPVTLHV